MNNPSQTKDMNELNNKIEEAVLYIKEQCIDTSDPGLVWFDFDKAQSQIKTLITEQVRLGKDEVLDELLEWHEYWSNQHEKPFNWYGAVKALKVSKDFKKPFNVLPTIDTTLLEGEKHEQPTN